MKVQDENLEFVLPPPSHPSEKYSFVELSGGKFPVSAHKAVTPAMHVDSPMEDFSTALFLSLAVRSLLEKLYAIHLIDKSNKFTVDLGAERLNLELPMLL